MMVPLRDKEQKPVFWANTCFKVTLHIAESKMLAEGGAWFVTRLYANVIKLQNQAQNLS